MNVDVIKLIAGALVGGVIYKIGKQEGRKEHMSEIKDILLKQYIEHQKEES